MELDPATSGVREVSYAKAEDVKSVSVERLVHRLGRVPAPELGRLADVLRLLLEL